MRAAGGSRGAHRSEISFHNFPRQYTEKSKPAINHVREQNHAFALRYSICAYLRLRRKSECGAAILLRLRRREKNQMQSVSEHWVFLPLTTLSYRSTRKKDFAERFFAKRSGERFKRGVRRSRTARKVRSAATMSVQKEIREPAIKPVAKGVTALCLLRLNLPLARLLRKSETVRAKMLPLARCREKPNAEPKANVGFF